MNCATDAFVRGAPLELARQRLFQIAKIARDTRGTNAICRQWSNSRFEQIENLAASLLDAPPVDLSALAMDELHLLRLALNSEMSMFTDLLEDVYDKPDWRIAYLCYFVPFALAILCDAGCRG